jgi:hypothetical protein
MPQTLISIIFSMLSIYDHADLSSVSRLMNRVSILPTSTLELYHNLTHSPFVCFVMNQGLLPQYGFIYSSHVFNWTNTRWGKEKHELDQQLLRHRRTRSVIIHRRAFHQPLKSLNELKWCTQLNWHVEYLLDLSSISGMISLQQLNLNYYKGDPSSIPLEYLPNLTSLTLRKCRLIHLAKIPNPLLLHHLAIAEISDWYSDGTAAQPPYIGSRFPEILRFISLRTLRLSRDANDFQQHRMDRLRMAALMSSLTQLQQLGIDSFEPLSEIEKNEPPSTWFGTIPLSLNEISYYEPTRDLTPFLAFPSLTKLELFQSDYNWDSLSELAPNLLSLALRNINDATFKIISKCTRLTSLIIVGGTISKLPNLDQLTSLPLKQLTLTNIDSDGREPSIFVSVCFHLSWSFVWLGEMGGKPLLVLLQSMCSIWSLSLTDLTIDIFGATLEDQIEALTLLRVIERLTLSNYLRLRDELLMKLSTHPHLPLTLTDISWKWISQGRRNNVHLDVRQSFTARGIRCDDIGDDWQPSSF